MGLPCDANNYCLEKMPNKRSKRGKKKVFNCPICGERLWRLGTTKYYLFYRSPAEIYKHKGISTKKAKFLISQNSTYLDTSRWVEGFHCKHDGNIWLTISLKDGEYSYHTTKETDWLMTSKTQAPGLSNPSVSDFSLRMSRKPYLK